MDVLNRRFALMKLAYFGYAGVNGTPTFTTPQMTVGQQLYLLNSNPYLPSNQVRQAKDSLVNSGIDVNTPLSKAIKTGIGALAGNFIAKNILKSSPFMQGVLTTLGANYGYNH